MGLDIPDGTARIETDRQLSRARPNKTKIRKLFTIVYCEPLTGQEEDMTAPIAKPMAALPKPNGDFYQVTESIDESGQAVLQKVRAFMENKVAPVINKYWLEDSFPFELVPGFRDLEVAGMGYHGYGCAGGSTLHAGFVAMEIARVD